MYQDQYTITHTDRANSGSGGRATSPPMDDERVLLRMRNAGNGDKFRELYDEGDCTKYGGNQDRGRKALCSLLAFYTQDPDQLARLVAHSALGPAPEETIAWVIAHTEVRYRTRGATPAQADVRFAEESDEEIAALCREELERRFKLRGALLDRISNLVHNTSTMTVPDKHGAPKERYILNPYDKLVGIEGYFETMSTGEGPQPPARVKVCRETLGRRIGVSASAAGDALDVLARHEYFGKRVVRRSPEDRALYLWPGRVVPASEQLQPLVPKHRGRARHWVCPQCGSGTLVRYSRYECGDCGHQVAAEDLQRAGVIHG